MYIYKLMHFKETEYIVLLLTPISDVDECNLNPSADNYTCQNKCGAFECIGCDSSSDNCTTGKSGNDLMLWDCL
jgi:hypothetical protein